MVKVRQVVGGSISGGLSGGASETNLLSGGAQSVPWFRAFYTVPLNLFVVYIVAALGFLGAAIYNFVSVHTESSSTRQQTMAIIFLVLAVWFVLLWPLIVQALA